MNIAYNGTVIDLQLFKSDALQSRHGMYILGALNRIHAKKNKEHIKSRHSIKLAVNSSCNSEECSTILKVYQVYNSQSKILPIIVRMVR
jgi:hypothetical protein